MTISEISGKTLAILMLRDDAPPGHDFVISGTVKCTDRGLLLERGPGDEPLIVPKTALARILPMTDEVRVHLGDAQYWLWLKVAIKGSATPALA